MLLLGSLNLVDLTDGGFETPMACCKASEVGGMFLRAAYGCEEAGEAAEKARLALEAELGDVMPLFMRPDLSSSESLLDHVEATRLALDGSGGRGSVGGFVGGGVLPLAVGDARPFMKGEGADTLVPAEPPDGVDVMTGLIVRLSGLLLRLPPGLAFEKLDTPRVEGGVNGE